MDAGERHSCELLIVARFISGWRHVANWFEQPTRIEPIDPRERGEFDRLEMPPWTCALNHLGLEESNHRFGEGVVVRIAATAHGWCNAGLRQPLRVAHRQILRPTIAVMRTGDLRPV